jgi:hypothetical protein
MRVPGNDRNYLPLELLAVSPAGTVAAQQAQEGVARFSALFRWSLCEPLSQLPVAGLPDIDRLQDSRS